MAAVLRASRSLNSVVDLSAVCEGLKMGPDACGEIVRWAEKAGPLNGLGNDQAIPTAAGRGLAEDLIAADG